MQYKTMHYNLLCIIIVIIIAFGPYKSTRILQELCSHRDRRRARVHPHTSNTFQRYAMQTNNKIYTTVFHNVVVSVSLLSTGHPCHRPCEGSPMTCEYNFTVEWYLTLSKACWNCPFNLTDCFRPHCVSADGHMRAVVTVNRQIPGPAIEVTGLTLCQISFLLLPNFFFLVH